MQEAIHQARELRTLLAAIGRMAPAQDHELTSVVTLARHIAAELANDLSVILESANDGERAR